MSKPLALAFLFLFCVTFPAAAQQPSVNLDLVIVTGDDGTEDQLVLTLLNANPNAAPLNLTQTFGDPGEQTPGRLSEYHLSFSADYCTVGGFELSVVGSDAWTPDSVQVTIDGVVLFDDPESEVFAPITAASYPLNGRWTRTTAYLSRCAPEQLVQAATPVPTQEAVIVTTPIVVITATPAAVLVPTPVTCPGFMPSRLVMGQQGRVTPGYANNLRGSPNRTAAVLGQIPGGEVFNVLIGPGCDPEGIAWWQVEYGGVTGWTAEGMGSEYFVEPVGG